MKQALNHIFKIIKHRRHATSVQSVRATVWRDWYMMLGGTAVALLAYFSVGAYIFLVTIQRIETNDDDIQTYQPPTSKEVMLTTATTLRERTQLFTSLRNGPPQAPDPGAVVSEEEGIRSEELSDEAGEEVTEEQILPE